MDNNNSQYKSPFSSGAPEVKNILNIMQNAEELVKGIKSGDRFTEGMTEEQKAEYHKHMNESGSAAAIASVEEKLAQLRSMAGNMTPKQP